MGWKKYDEQFRMRRSMNPLISWADIDTELLLMLFTPKRHTLQQQGGGGRKNTLPTTNVLIFVAEFQYVHRCMKCSGGHHLKSCFYDIGNLQLQSSNQFAN